MTNMKIQRMIAKSFFRTTACVAILCISTLLWTSPLHAQSVPEELMGDWTLDLESGEPAWMSVIEKDGRPFAHMRIYIGSDGPFEVTQVENGRIQFSIKP